MSVMKGVLIHFSECSDCSGGKFYVSIQILFLVAYCLRGGFAVVCLLGFGFEHHREHGYLYVATVVCGQIEFSSSD